MKLDQFMRTLKETAAYVRQGEGEERRDGIACQLCLTADGKVSSEQTAITISFFVRGAI